MGDGLLYFDYCMPRISIKPEVARVKPLVASSLRDKVLLEMLPLEHLWMPQFWWHSRIHNVSWLQMKRKKSNCDYQKKRQTIRSRDPQQEWVSREKGKSKELRVKDKGSGSTSLKTTTSVPSRLMAKLSPYQTYQRQQGWLKALNGWS